MDETAFFGWISGNAVFSTLGSQPSAVLAVAASTHKNVLLQSVQLGGCRMCQNVAKTNGVLF